MEPAIVRLAVLIDLGYKLLKNAVCLVVINLTSSGILVTAATILEAHFADVRLRSAIDDRFTDSENRVLLLQSPENVT